MCIRDRDPTFHVVNNAETHQTVISGAGDIQIDVLCAKLKSRFGVDAELSLSLIHIFQGFQHRPGGSVCRCR